MLVGSGATIFFVRVCIYAVSHDYAETAYVCAEPVPLRLLSYAVWMTDALSRAEGR